MWKLNNLESKIKKLEFKFYKNLWADLLWLYKTAFRWQWMEFRELREYVFWDSIKHIDWKTTAKTWKMQTRIYDEERDLNVLFVIDNSSFMQKWFLNKTKKDLAEEVFYALALSAISNNDNIWALFYDEEEVLDFINFKKWIWNLYRIIEKWDEYENKNSFWEAGYTFKALKKIFDLRIKRTLIFILTTDTNFDNKNILKLVGGDNEIIIINLFDSIENDLSILWKILNSDNKNIINEFWIDLLVWDKKDFLSINLWDKVSLEKYKKNREQKLEKLKNFLLKNKISYLKIENLDNSNEKLLEFFKKR